MDTVPQTHLWLTLSLASYCVRGRTLHLPATVGTTQITSHTQHIHMQKQTEQHKVNSLNMVHYAPLIPGQLPENPTVRPRNSGGTSLCCSPGPYPPSQLYRPAGCWPAGWQEQGRVPQGPEVLWVQIEHHGVSHLCSTRALEIRMKTP